MKMELKRTNVVSRSATKKIGYCVITRSVGWLVLCSEHGHLLLIHIVYTSVWSVTKAAFFISACMFRRKCQVHVSGVVPHCNVRLRTFALPSLLLLIVFRQVIMCSLAEFRSPCPFIRTHSILLETRNRVSWADINLYHPLGTITLNAVIP